MLMMSSNEEERYQARSRVKAALQDVLTKVSFDHQTGRVTVLAVEGKTRTVMTDKGLIIDAATRLRTLQLRW